jgi:hypothetical protein
MPNLRSHSPLVVLMLAVLMVMSVVALAATITPVNLNQGLNFVPGSASVWSGATTTNVPIQIYQWVLYEVFPVSNGITQPGVQTLKLAKLGVYSNGGLLITFNWGSPTNFTGGLNGNSIFWWMANIGGINPTVTATYTDSDGNNYPHSTVSSGPLTLTTSPVKNWTSLPSSVGSNLTLGLTQNVPPDANAGGFSVPVTVVISTTVIF